MFSSPHLRIQPSSCLAVWEGLIFQAVHSASLNLERSELTAVLSTSQTKCSFMHMCTVSGGADSLWLSAGLESGMEVIRQKSSTPNSPQSNAEGSWCSPLCPLYLFNHDLALDQLIETLILLGIESLNNTFLSHLAHGFAQYTVLLKDMDSLTRRSSFPMAPT